MPYADPEKKREYDKRWRQSPEGKAWMKEYSRRYREENRDKIRERKRAWLKTPKGKANRKAVKRRYENRKRGAVDQEPYNVEDLLGDECLACGSTDTLVLDHVVPISWGGADKPANLQTLCHMCNSLKGDRSDHDYREKA